MAKVEAVARAICEAAGKTVHKVHCPMCDPDTHQCTMWKEFRDEARAAIRALRQI